MVIATRDPAEVGCIGFLKRGQEEDYSVTYTNGDPGLIATLELELVEPSTGTIIVKKMFVGGPPPKIMFKRGDVGETGEKPDKDVLKYLSGKKWKTAEEVVAWKARMKRNREEALREQ